MTASSITLVGEKLGVDPVAQGRLNHLGMRGLFVGLAVSALGVERVRHHLFSSPRRTSGAELLVVLVGRWLSGAALPVRRCNRAGEPWTHQKETPPSAAGLHSDVVLAAGGWGFALLVALNQAAPKASAKRPGGRRGSHRVFSCPLSGPAAGEQSRQLVSKVAPAA